MTAPTARFSHLASRPDERAGRRLLAGVILRRKVWRRQVVNLTPWQAAQHDADTAWFKRLYRRLLRAARADTSAQKEPTR